MTVKLGDMLYEPSTKRIGMVTDEIKDGWRAEWNDGEIEYLWNHTVAHYKSRWECLKADIANGYV